MPKLDDIYRLLIDERSDRFGYLYVVPGVADDGSISLQLWGWAIVLNADGTWYWKDTSGG